MPFQHISGMSSTWHVFLIAHLLYFGWYIYLLTHFFHEHIHIYAYSLNTVHILQNLCFANKISRCQYWIYAFIHKILIKTSHFIRHRECKDGEDYSSLPKNSQSDKERQINTYLQSDVINAKGAKEKLSVQVGKSSWKRSHWLWGLETKWDCPGRGGRSREALHLERIACAFTYVCKMSWHTWEAVNCLEFFDTGTLSSGVVRVKTVDRT